MLVQTGLKNTVLDKKASFTCLCCRVCSIYEVPYGLHLCCCYMPLVCLLLILLLINA